MGVRYKWKISRKKIVLILVCVEVSVGGLNNESLTIDEIEGLNPCLCGS